MVDVKSWTVYVLGSLFVCLFVVPFLWEWAAIVLESSYAFSLVCAVLWRFQDWLWAQAAIIVVQLSLIFDNRMTTAFWNVVLFWWRVGMSWRHFFYTYDSEADETGKPHTVRIGTAILIIVALAVSALIPKTRRLWIRLYDCGAKNAIATVREEIAKDNQLVEASRQQKNKK